MISYKLTEKILKEHGIGMNTTACVNNGEWVDNSSFIAEFGVKDSYKYNDVMIFLGY